MITPPHKPLHTPPQTPPPAPSDSAAAPPLPAAPMTPLIKGTLVWHGAMLAAGAWQPQTWPWIVGGIASNHVALTIAGLLPRSALLGPNWRSLPPDPSRPPSIALTFDDGPDPQLTPFVLEQLARHRVRASFFCIGHKVRAFPALAREIVAAGHTVENHTDSHSHQFAFLGPAGFTRAIEPAQHAIADITGSAPRFFRAPAGLRNPFLQPVLARLNLQLAAWTRRGFDTVARDPARVLDRLTAGLAADDILLLHDGHGAHDAAGQPVLRTVLPALLGTMAEQGLQGITLREARRPDGRPARPSAAGAVTAGARR